MMTFCNTTNISYAASPAFVGLGSQTTTVPMISQISASFTNASIYDTSQDVVMEDAFDTHYGNDVVMHDAFDTHYGDDTLMNPHPYKSDAWWHEEMMRDL